jgi:hypothetical protein
LLFLFSCLQFHIRSKHTYGIQCRRLGSPSALGPRGRLDIPSSHTLKDCS